MRERAVLLPCKPRRAPCAVRHATVLASALLALAARAPAAIAQPIDARGEVFVGSEMETYLRVLQTLGEVQLYPWSLRGFSPAELDHLAPHPDSVHPWGARYRLEPAGRFAWHWIRPEARSIYNSALPYGSNDGVLWAGRGVTNAVQGGFAMRAGALSLSLAPVAFRAANRPFDLQPTGQSGRLVYADPRIPTGIDLPQRFGDDAYARLDLGESTLRLDALGVALGVSTASQQWGPAREYPLILGNNAGGFLHTFAGTAHPLDLWVGRVHGRMVWGRLEQSPFSPVEGRSSRRLMSGLVGTFTPRGVPGLELGASRFFHSPWPEQGVGMHQLTKPLEGLLKTGLGGKGTEADPYSDADNQLGSVFFRWVLPQSGFELYGEYARDDHNWDLRDFLLEPDHISGYTLGFQRAWHRDPAQIWVLRGEVLNSRITHLQEVRHQSPLYPHSATRQGHTHRGQGLGAPAAYGGGGAALALDRYHAGGRWSLSWERTLRAERNLAEGLPENMSDVQHALGVEALVFRGSWELTGALRGVYEFNRTPGSDAFNLNAAFGVRWGHAFTR